MPFSTIAMKLRLVLFFFLLVFSITNRNFIANFIFLKVVVINIRDILLAQTILRHKLILHQQSTIQKREFSGIY